MIQSAIILAGGLGTRLRSAVPDLPKCMAPVNGRPFIGYVIEHFRQQGIQHFIFALGYKSEAFHDYLEQSAVGSYDLSIEEEPLGTGGGIRQACSLLPGTHAIVANGDTLFKANLGSLANFHTDRNADCTLCLKPMQQFSRYGVVEIDAEQRILDFKEKQFYESGYINGGVYALNGDRFLQEDLPAKFSFEKDYLEKHYTTRPMYGIVQDVYFIDIGIPEDYEKAQQELK